MTAIPATASPVSDKQAEAQRVLGEIQQIDVSMEKIVEAYDAAQGKLERIVAEQKLNLRNLHIARSNYAKAETQLSQRLLDLYTSHQESALEVLLTASAAGAGDATLRQQVDRLRESNAAIAARSRSAALELYALESRLARAERLIGKLEREQAAVQRREQSARERLRIARHVADVAEEQLNERLRALYIGGDVDPLALLLGAQSLDEALSTLDHLNSLAEQDRQILAQTRTARANLHAALREKAKDARSALLQAKAERVAYLSQLARQKNLNESQIAQLTAEAQQAESRSTTLTGSSGDSGSGGGPVSGELTVVVTGYSLKGTTATGIPAGWGVVAVDPSVIPLGTKMTVPGYGEGVAADTGSAVIGNRIDLWFPTTGQALAWGARTMTITLH
ncbi:MAG: hypothetical protein E6G67_14150 [Actinobacteria bacterium]|nr:MAG: hypothetical protein E6G67_14150 [Actinomycetota bacterium]